MRTLWLCFALLWACDDGGGQVASPMDAAADLASVDGAIELDARAPDATPTPDAGPVDARVVGDAMPDAAAADAAPADAAVVLDAARLEDASPPDMAPVDAAPQTTWRVLLIGNSYVASNRLDRLLRNLLEDDPVVESAEVVAVTRGGYRLPQHADDADTPGSALHGHLVDPGSDWDAVVLQEQSQIPGFPPAQAEYQAMLTGGRRLHALAQARGARTAVLLTWGRRDGDNRNPDLFPDFETMQGRLNAGYLALSAATGDAVIAPAGPAFAVIHAADMEIFRGLYTNDGSHPSRAGSYVAAAVLYRVLTGRPAADRSWAPDGLEGADRLRAWADEAQAPE